MACLRKCKRSAVNPLIGDYIGRNKKEYFGQRFFC
jgi:hypothetical protein